MDSVDLSVLKTLREWQAGDLPLWLVTVADTFGSSPRPPVAAASGPAAPVPRRGSAGGRVG